MQLDKTKEMRKFKGRCAANGSRQREFLKEDKIFASPTVSLEGLLATLVIDAKKERKVNTFDAPGAFLQALIPQGKRSYLN